MPARRLTASHPHSAAGRGGLGGVVVGHGAWLHSTVRCDADGVRIGNQCRLLRGVLLRGPDVVLCDRVFCNDGVYIDRTVTVQDDVRCGHPVPVITGPHEIGALAPASGQASQCSLAP